MTEEGPWHDPAEYAGQGVCPCCGSGWPCCADRRPDGGYWTHEDTCAKYRWSDDVCGRCSLEMAQESP